MGGWLTTAAGARVVEVGERVVTDPAARFLAWFERPDEQYRLVALAMWQLVFVFYVVGDTTLTTVVLELGGYEANPVARAFLRTFGYPGLIVQKGLALLALGVFWKYYPAVGVDSPDPWRLVVPAIPFLRGIQLVAIHLGNIAVLA
jgi:hypothetical protein